MQSLTLPLVLSVISTIVTAIFAFIILSGWWAKPRLHMLAWGVGLFLYFLGSLSQVVLTFVWSPLFFALWYWCGALMVITQLFEPLMLNMGNYDVAIRQVLVNAFMAANQRLFDHPAYGTTAMTAALVNGHVAYIAHVGDTSAHAITPDAVSPLTKMHHLAHKLVEKGQATWEQINQNEVDVTNVLYRTLGKAETLEVDVITYQLDRNRQLLLCSDGLSGWNWEQVTKNDVNGIMLSAYDLQFACNRLVSLAQERESIDAVTAIMIGIQ